MKDIFNIIKGILVVITLYFGFLFAMFGLTKDGTTLQSLGGLLAILVSIRYCQYWYKQVDETHWRDQVENIEAE